MKTKLLFSLLGMLFILQSCTKENCTQTYDGITYMPVYAPMNTLRSVNVQPAKAITSNGKIFIKGNYIFLNEVDKGFHIIDNTNPAAPQRILFVSVPGNLDMIAKGNYLFVDNYLDLLTFDITNPASIQLVKRSENALPFRQYNYGFADNAANGIIVSFDKKVEKVEMDCSNNGFVRFDNGGLFLRSASVSPVKSLGGANGQAGSLSRFAMVANYLYVANRYSLTPIDITNAINPIVKPTALQQLDEFETLYGFNNSLLAGGPTGMYILNLSNPAIPTLQGTFRHWRGCDPVVAQNNTAYVTVRGSGPCGGTRNFLDAIDISNLDQPILIKTYQLENPYGLGIFNNKLGVCDGAAGFKIFNAGNSNNLQLQSTVSSINAFDVIMNDERALLIAKDGMYQYNISNSSNPILLSKISINP
ncbi:MAG: hypothetical protein LH615_02885 [Ferruginibacter sp.]|nr:hypothetical protein [Ferruginibacter sp.]